jgi:hypothetical protein
VRAVLFLSSETGSHYVAQAGLELMILLPQTPECWDYSHMPPCPVVMAFLLAESRGGTEHHMARDRESEYVFWSLLIKLPIFNRGGSIR